MRVRLRKNPDKYLGYNEIHETLMCQLRYAEVDHEHLLVRMYAPPCNAPDMGGAIEIARRMMANVERVEFYEGTELVNVYQLVGEDWEAFR